MEKYTPFFARSALLAAALVAVAALGGCRNAALVEPPASLEESLAAAPPSESATPEARAAAEAGLASPDYAVDPAWWRVYGDEQLNALVERAFANNLDLAQSAVSVRQALIQAYQLGVDLQPQFSAGLSASLRRNIKDGGPSSQSYGADVGVGYEVDLWRRLRDVREAQEWEVMATVQDEASARLALANAVIDAYYHLAYILDATAAVLDSMENYERIEKIARVKYEEGGVPAIEQIQARQSWLANKATLIGLQGQRKTVEQTLRDLLNLRPSEPLEAIPPSLVDFELKEVDLDVPLSALSNRPDLRAAEFRLRRAFTSLGATRKSWYPTLSLGGSLSSSGSRAGRMFNVPMTGGTVAVDFPFLRWNTVKANVWMSEASYESARLDFERAVTTALNEVDAYHYAYRRARESLDNSKEKYVNDVKVGEYYQARYEEAAGELKDWLDALNSVTNSRLSTVSDRYEAMRCENLVHKAMAGRYVKKG